MKLQPAKRLNEQDHKLLALWAADCAEHVLPFFEEQYPEDDRPRKAIAAARAWARGEIKCGQARAAAVAAHAAAREADEGAARAAGHAAGTAHMAAYARLRRQSRRRSKLDSIRCRRYCGTGLAVSTVTGTSST